jgi:hypothetical protein
VGLAVGAGRPGGPADDLRAEGAGRTPERISGGVAGRPGTDAGAAEGATRDDIVIGDATRPAGKDQRRRHEERELVLAVQRRMLEERERMGGLGGLIR